MEIKEYSVSNIKWFSFRGKTSNAIFIFLSNVFMTIISCGLLWPYTFLRNRKFTINNLALNKIPLRFTNITTQMALRYIFAVFSGILLILITIGGLEELNGYLIINHKEVAETAFFSVCAILVLIAILITKYAKRAKLIFFLKNVSYLGVNGGTTTKSYSFAFKATILEIFNLLTLKIFHPYFQDKETRILVTGLYLGDAKIEYKGKFTGKYYFLNLISLLLIPFTFYASRAFWYKAIETRYIANKIHFGKYRIRCKISGWDYFFYNLTLVFMPFMNLTFYPSIILTKFGIEGNLDNMSILPSQHFSEEYGDAIDILFSDGTT